MKTKMAVIKRRPTSQRSHEKIGDCEQSISARESEDNYCQDKYVINALQEIC